MSDTPSIRIHTPQLAFPEVELSMKDFVGSFEELYSRKVRNKERLLSIFHNAGVHRRYVSGQPIALSQMTDLRERNLLYQEQMKKYCGQAARAALLKAHTQAHEIDMVISVSCTGFMIPSVETFLIPELGMKPTTKRLPITEIGCAGGLYGLNRAVEYCKGHPGSKVLLVAAEFCSLAMVPEDLSMQALVGMALFGDGVAATVVSSDTQGTNPTSAPFVFESMQSMLVPESHHYMGFDLGAEGFRLILDRVIAKAMSETVGPVIQTYLEDRSIESRDLNFFAIHPGGKKLLVALEDFFSLDANALHASYSALRDYGNLSSASILAVLNHLERDQAMISGQQGLFAAFGPGFTIELMNVTHA